MAMTEDRRRELAIKRLKDKADFRIHLLVYLSVNAMLVAVWALTGGVVASGTNTSFTFFWPVFPIFGWGVGLVAHAYTVYFGRASTEDEIQREMRRQPF